MRARQEEQQQQHLIREGEDDELAEQQEEPEEDTGMRMGQINKDGAHGALVQEALQKMAEEEDDPGQKKEEDSGPKIKMGKIGKGKKGKKRSTAGGDAGNQESYTKKLGGVGIGDVDPRPSGALNEQDIEFMKKAI